MNKECSFKRKNKVRVLKEKISLTAVVRTIAWKPTEGKGKPWAGSHSFWEAPSPLQQEELLGLASHHPGEGKVLLFFCSLDCWPLFLPALVAKAPIVTRQPKPPLLCFLQLSTKNWQKCMRWLFGGRLAIFAAITNNKKNQFTHTTTQSCQQRRSKLFDAVILQSVIHLVSKRQNLHTGNHQVKESDGNLGTIGFSLSSNEADVENARGTPEEGPRGWRKGQLLV